jgi:hypothetical protein
MNRNFCGWKCEPGGGSGVSMQAAEPECRLVDEGSEFADDF